MPAIVMLNSVSDEVRRGIMEDVPPLRIHEVETYFSIIAGLSDERTLRARSFHNVGTFGHDDYLALSETLTDLDSSATIAVLGRDMDELAPTVEELYARGHEIALHGHRHVRATDFPAEDIRENLACGLEAIEDATGIRPRGYFPPLQEIGEAGLQAASELDLEWVFGQPTAVVPDDYAMVEPVNPYDMKLVRGSEDPETALEPLFNEISDGKSFLFHPNMIEYFGATEQFDKWLAAAQPISVTEQLESGGVGIVIDANRPLRIE